MTFDRNQGIGATDARIIMAGDWLQLWREKTGRAPAPDLSDVFRVQLGRQTEAFHIEWVGRRQKVSVKSYRDDEGRVEDLALPWRWATLDGHDLTHNVPIEVKHSNSSATIRDRADFYMAQIQHNLAVTGCEWLWFSVIPGNDEPMTVRVDRSQEYIDKLTELERTFWWHVKQDVAPDITPSAEIARVNAIVPAILVGGYTAPMDLSRNNAFMSLAAEYIALKPMADRCDEVNKDLKALIDPSWGGAFGGGLTISRNKKGTLTLRIDKEDDLEPAITG